jgi:hypothetical protein
VIHIYFFPTVALSSVQILNGLVYCTNMSIPAFYYLNLNLKSYLKSDEQVTNLGNKCPFRHFVASLVCMSQSSIWNDNYHPLSTVDMLLKIETTVSNFASGVLYLNQFYLICNLTYSIPPAPCFLNFLYTHDFVRYCP